MIILQAKRPYNFWKLGKKFHFLRLASLKYILYYFTNFRILVQSKKFNLQWAYAECLSKSITTLSPPLLVFYFSFNLLKKQNRLPIAWTSWNSRNIIIFKIVYYLFYNILPSSSPIRTIITKFPKLKHRGNILL